MILLKKNNQVPGIIALLIFAVAVSGCTVSLSVDSSCPGARILTKQVPAKNHGWIEIAVLDEKIRCADFKSGKKPGPCRASVCSLEVNLDKKQYAHEHISAFGDKPPFRVDTGFRFAAPAGELEIEMIFTCLSGPNQPEAGTSVVAVSTINVKEGMVTELMFDGQKITFLGQRQDHAAGLEDFKKESNVKNDKIRQRSF